MLGNHSALGSFWQMLTEAQSLQDLSYVLESQMGGVEELRVGSRERQILKEVFPAECDEDTDK